MVRAERRRPCSRRKPGFSRLRPTVGRLARPHGPPAGSHRPQDSSWPPRTRQRGRRSAHLATPGRHRVRRARGRRGRWRVTGGGHSTARSLGKNAWPFCVSPRRDPHPDDLPESQTHCATPLLGRRSARRSKRAENVAGPRPRSWRERRGGGLAPRDPTRPRWSGPPWGPRGGAARPRHHPGRRARVLPHHRRLRGGWRLRAVECAFFLSSNLPIDGSGV